MEILINNIQLDYLLDKCREHQETKYNHVDVSDILYSYLNTGYILNDWDEGESNDPFLDKENNCHSAESFINEMVKYLHN